MSDKVGQPMEFDEGSIEGELPVVVGGSKAQLQVATEAPRKPVQIVTGGGRRVTVMVVDKAARFMVPAEQLRARWCSVAVRGASGRVLVYDRAGELLARFADLKEANQGFKEAGILDAVTTSLKEDSRKRAAAEKQARERLAAQKAT